jgi:hypothetical protein
VDVNQGAQVGKTASEGYLNSFNALGQLSQQGMGASQNAAGAAMSGYGAANQGFGAVYNDATQQKGQTMGAISAGVSDAVAIGAAPFTGGASLMGLAGGSGGGGGGMSMHMPGKGGGGGSQPMSFADMSDPAYLASS